MWQYVSDTEEKAWKKGVDCKPGGGIQARAAAGAGIRGGDKRGSSTICGSEGEAAPGTSARGSFEEALLPSESLPSPPGKASPDIYTTRMSCPAPSSMVLHHTYLLQNFPGLVKAMVFPVVMCGCESWTIKKAERQKIDAFDL